MVKMGYKDNKKSNKKKPASTCKKSLTAFLCKCNVFFSPPQKHAATQGGVFSSGRSKNTRGQE